MENIEKFQGDSTNIKLLSDDVNQIYLEYKSRIEEIIHDNYGLNKEDKILDMFRKIGLEISSRNNELLQLLENKYNLDFMNKLDFSGGIKVSKISIDGLQDSNIKDFFNSEYVIDKGSNIDSRGYGYYFNFDGFDNDGTINYNLHPGEYFANVEKYFISIKKSLSYFEGKQVNNLDDSEKEVFLSLLDHYKNILYFYQNFIILMSDKEKLAKQVGNVAGKNFDKYYSYEKLSNSSEYIKEINHELENIVFIFSDLLLSIENKVEIKFGKTLDTTLFKYSSDFFEQSFKKQEEIVNDLELKENNGKKTDIKGTKKFITKTNNKFIGNLLRIIREEDNSIKQLFASYNIASGIPDEIENIDINGMLYGGIEIPYFMKYVLIRFYNKDTKKLKINLTAMSAYHNRNLKRVSNADEYSEIEKDTTKKMQLVLDDNLFYGSTLQVGGNNLMDRGPVLSGVSEIGLRRGKLGKLEEGKSLNFLLSKINGAASVTPIERNAKGGSYKNLVNKFIKKKLPKLVGKF